MFICHIITKFYHIRYKMCYLNLFLQTSFSKLLPLSSLKWLFRWCCFSFLASFLWGLKRKRLLNFLKVFEQNIDSPLGNTHRYRDSPSIPFSTSTATFMLEPFQLWLWSYWSSFHQKFVPCILLGCKKGNFVKMRPL